MPWKLAATVALLVCPLGMSAYSQPSEEKSAGSDTSALLTEIAELRAQLVERKREIALLNVELSRVRQRLAAESEARIVIERRLAISEDNAALVRPAAEAADPRYRGAMMEPDSPERPEAASLPDPAVSLPAAPEEPRRPEGPVRPSAPQVVSSQLVGSEFEGTGEFTLLPGDQWRGDGSADVFRVLGVFEGSASRLDHADVKVFGENALAEQGTNFLRMMESGYYSITVLKVDGEAGTVTVAVEREG